jgi:hypothetical protein
VNKDKLQQIIAELEANAVINKPFAGMYELVESRYEDGYTIKANKEGLIELAIALLKATQEDYYHDGPNIIDLEVGHKINPGDDSFLPERIELTANPFVPPVIKKAKSWSGRFFPAVGCLLVFAFIIISLVVGIIAVFRWIF